MIRGLVVRRVVLLLRTMILTITLRTLSRKLKREAKKALKMEVLPRRNLKLHFTQMVSLLVQMVPSEIMRHQRTKSS